MTIGSIASALVGINLLAYVMVLLRPRLYKSGLYRPMLVNIRLSILPIAALGITLLLFILLQGVGELSGGGPAVQWLSVAVLALGLLVWVLLLPNAGYLITELNFNHRDHDKVEVPLWYDIVGVLTLAMSGVMNMCFNIFIIQFIVALLAGIAADFTFLLSWASTLVTVLLMVLASFGIYLGRYIRFNSWDVKHPVQFVKKLKKHFSAPGSIKNSLLFVVFHTLFFYFFYQASFGLLLGELLPTAPLLA